MAACEKCWGDAFGEAIRRGGSQADRYRELLAERKNTPCTSEQQRGSVGAPGHDPPRLAERAAWGILERAGLVLAEPPVSGVPCVDGAPHAWADATVLGATTRRYVCERCSVIREAAGSL
jgi:hypothetical protein